MSDKDVATGEELQLENELEQSESQDDSDKMLPVSRVNELVKKAKHKGERRMQDKLDAVTQELEQLRAQQSQPQNQMGMGGMAQVDPDQIRQQVLEQVQQDMIAQQQSQQQKLIEQQAQQISDQFDAHMKNGAGKYEDFDAVTADFEPQAFPDLVLLTSQMDNAADIIYELTKNPSKLVTVNDLAKASPRMAMAQLAKLSDSIKVNQQAMQDERQAAEPLDRLKPSSVGVDNGQGSIRDLRSNPALRG